MKKNLLILAVVLFFIPSVFALMQPGFFVSDDGEWMVIRFSAFFQSLRDGQFPVRFLSRLNFGYGYPVSNFLYPGFLYLGVPIHILGFSFVNTIKIILGFSLIGSGFFTYLWLRKSFDSFESIIGSLFYVYTPYHLYDVYTRGSVGEVLGLAVIPFIFWSLEKKNISLSALGIGILILSHNTLALLFLPILLIYAILFLGKIKHTVIIFILGLGFSSFFWIPAITEISLTRFSQTTISQYGEYFASTKLIGISSISILLFCITHFFYTKKYEKKSYFFLIVGILSVVFSLSISNNLWKFIPVDIIQFPFRILSLLIPSIAFLSAYTLSLFKKKQYIIGGVLIICLVFSAFEYIYPSEFSNKPDGIYATNQGSTTVKNEYMSFLTRINPSALPNEKVLFITGSGYVMNLVSKSNNITFSVKKASHLSKIQINTSYFSGWKAWGNGLELPIQISPNSVGEMIIVVPDGDSNIEIKFQENIFRLFADVLTIISCIIIIIIFIKDYFNKNE